MCKAMPFTSYWAKVFCDGNQSRMNHPEYRLMQIISYLHFRIRARGKFHSYDGVIQYLFCRLVRIPSQIEAS